MHQRRPIVNAVACALCEANGGNPYLVPFGEVQSSWPMWMDHTKAARAALDRTAIMLQATGHSTAAQHIINELALDDTTQP